MFREINMRIDELKLACGTRLVEAAGPLWMSRGFRLDKCRNWKLEHNAKVMGHPLVEHEWCISGERSFSILCDAHGVFEGVYADEKKARESAALAAEHFASELRNGTV